MRIVAGTHKGMRLKTLKGDTTRPTSEKVKNALFSKIGPFFSGGTVAEMFGGSGSISLEALSRGMKEAYIFEKHPKAVQVIKDNVSKCRMDDQVMVFKTDARNAARLVKKYGEPVSLLYVDPPYSKVDHYEWIHDWIKRESLVKDAIIICEHQKGVQLPESYGPYVLKDQTTYGSSVISIYKGE